MRNNKISFAGPWITKAEIDYVAQAVEDGWYETFDKYMKGFEDEIKSYFQIKYAIGTHCCTQALHLACAAIDLKSGDEVIVPDHSWVATAYSIAYTGARCVFVDIDPQTLCIDPEAIIKAITPKTKAIMLVHNFGVPAEMDEILEIAKAYKLLVIEDAAPALGSTYKGVKCGTIGDVGCISFQGAKIAASSEGGVLITNNEKIFHRATILASMGRTDRVAAFWSDEIGYQYTIGSLPAAMATVQIRRADELVANKRKHFEWYEQRLAIDPRITMVKEKKDTYANYTYPSIWLSDEVKVPAPTVVAKLKQLNIHCRPAFPQMSLFPVFNKEKRFDNPVAKKFMEKGVVLPSAHNLTEEDADFVCQSLFDAIK
jgi:perosamine synthetase